MASIWNQAVENVRQGFLNATMGQGIDSYQAEQFFLSVTEEAKESFVTKRDHRMQFALARESLATEEENEHRKQRHTFHCRQLLENCGGLSEAIVPALERYLLEEYDYLLELHLRRLIQQRSKPAVADAIGALISA